MAYLLRSLGTAVNLQTIDPQVWHEVIPDHIEMLFMKWYETEYTGNWSSYYWHPIEEIDEDVSVQSRYESVSIIYIYDESVESLSGCLFSISHS